MAKTLYLKRLPEAGTVSERIELMRAYGQVVSPNMWWVLTWDLRTCPMGYEGPFATAKDALIAHQKHRRSFIVQILNTRPETVSS